MQSQVIAPRHGHGHADTHEADPHSVGLNAEGEEKHHDDKPAVLKKVKEKVKKIKDKISKKKHGESSSGEEEEEEVVEEEDGYEEDDDPQINSGPTERVAPEKVKELGDFTGDVKEDPAAPRSTNPPARGGEEIGTTPVIQAFESMAVSDEPMPEPEPKTETLPSDTGSTDHHNVPYTEKLKSMAAVPAEYGKYVAATAYDKISSAGTAVVHKIRGGPTNEGNKETSAVADRDKGVSVKEYLSEKLKPGEEDQALSEVISEAMQRRREETDQTKAGGVRMVEQLRGVVTSVVGGREESDTHKEEGPHEAAEPMKLD